jgi:uncharacterized lipoprotein YehR (DUF1307 family)
MKICKDIFSVIFAILLVASVTGCAGGGSASGGVNIKGKKIGYVPPS